MIASSQFNYDLNNVVHMVISYQEYAVFMLIASLKAEIIAIDRKFSSIKP